LSHVPDEPGGIPEKNIRDVQRGSEHAHPLSSSVSGAGPWPLGTGFAIGHESILYQSLPKQSTVMNLQIKPPLFFETFWLEEERPDVTRMLVGKWVAGLY